jgi:hypothetical protein
VIDIYEVNRKEAARILLDVDRWFTRSTFQARQGTAVVDEGSAGVQLELSVMEVGVLNFGYARNANSHLDDLELHVRPSTVKTKAHLLSCADHRSL